MFQWRTRRTATSSRWGTCSCALTCKTWKTWPGRPTTRTTGPSASRAWPAWSLRSATASMFTSHTALSQYDGITIWANHVKKTKILINSQVFCFLVFLVFLISLFLHSKLTRESGTDFPIIQGATESETEKLIREKDEEVRHAGREPESHQQHERSEAQSKETHSDQKDDEELWQECLFYSFLPPTYLCSCFILINKQSFSQQVGLVPPHKCRNKTLLLITSPSFHLQLINKEFEFRVAWLDVFWNNYIL